MKKKPDEQIAQGATDLDVEALVDTQLGAEREEQVWRDISLNPALYAQYDRLMSQKRQLKAWWDLETADNRQSLLSCLSEDERAFAPERFLTTDQKSPSRH
jgi:hypothetical protein